MRVGLIRFKYDQAGGAEKTLLLLAEGLLARGHRVHVLTTNWEGHRPEGLGVHYAYVDRTPPRAQLRDWAVTAANLMAQYPADTYLSLDRVPGSPVVRAGDGCHAAWLEHRAPYSSALKRLSFKLNPKHRTFLWLERATFGAPELRRVIANSRLVADELRRYCGVPPEKISVVYNGVDEARLAPAREPGTRQRARAELGLDGPALLFLGSGFERKGLAFAIKALAQLPGVTLLVAGKDRQGPYRRLAKKLGLAGRVRFLGQRGNVASLLAAADALVLPTIYDPCANACLEALWAGLPVVTTSGNGASELINQGVDGFIVPRPDNAAALARACADALRLQRGFANRVPSLEQWLDQTMAILENTAQETDNA